MRISYSAWKSFKDCPKQFDLMFVQRIKSKIKENKYHTLYGSLVGKFFEFYCNKWRFQTPYMFPEDIKERLKKLYVGVLDTTPVDWSARCVTASKEDILNIAYGDILTIMDSSNQNFFLNTRSEITINIMLKNNHSIFGRLDFIHKDALSESVTLMDGKGTDKIGKNIDQDQILFYTLLYFLHTGKIPDEAGFFYFRLNKFSRVPIDLDMLNVFRARLSIDIKSITSDVGKKATPSSKSCKYCVYRTDCSENLARIAESKRPSVIKDIEHDGELVEFGF